MKDHQARELANYVRDYLKLRLKTRHQCLRECIASAILEWREANDPDFLANKIQTKEKNNEQ